MGAAFDVVLTTRIPLVQQTGDESAVDDGLIMFDREGPYGVISMNGIFDPIVTHSMQHGHGRFTRTTDADVSATNTAYTVVFDTTEISEGGVALAHLLVELL